MSVASLLSQPPIWREGRLGLEMAALRRDPVYRGEGVPHGEGRPVLLIPGFLAGDLSLSTMTGWLRRNGYWTRKAGMRANIDCSGAAIRRIEERLGELAAARGRVSIIGQSRGGAFAKALAVRRPDLVAGIVTLGSPIVAQLAVHPLVRLQVLAVGALGTLGAPGMFRRTCLAGDCCTEFVEALASPVGADVGYVAIYSRSDGIVSWSSCLDPSAEDLVEVRASHLGMGVNAAAYRAIAAALTRFADAAGKAAAPVASSAAA
jgi:triacylglycerol lipase